MILSLIKCCRDYASGLMVHLQTVVILSFSEEIYGYDWTILGADDPKPPAVSCRCSDLRRHSCQRLDRCTQCHRFGGGDQRPFNAAGGAAGRGDERSRRHCGIIHGITWRCKNLSIRAILCNHIDSIPKIHRRYSYRFSLRISRRSAYHYCST